jgi:glycosyltransferase involved in cell wall biosynthesis
MTANSMTRCRVDSGNGRAIKRVLMVSPHFPPDTNAATHRVRLLAPHLRKYGWEPTIVSVDPRDYDGRLDEGLAQLVPPDLRVVRCRAWPSRWTRRVGVGDLGLRAARGLHQTCSRLLAREPFDALFITIWPPYPALLGPMLKRRFHVPFVLDYQDPWVGAWGKTAGPRPDGRPDLKSRLMRLVATRLEPWALRGVDAITAVSAGTYEEVLERNPWRRGVPCASIPLGGEQADFEAARRDNRPNVFFDAADGLCHVCYVGTLLPMGFETLRAVLRAAALLRQRQPEVYGRLRLHFFGTSNMTDPQAPPRVLPVAHELGVTECVTEHPPRVDYLHAIRVQTQATALLLMGSSERHYTASKLYPALLSRRPLLAVYHEVSSVVSILQRAASPPTVRLVTYDDGRRAEAQVEAIAHELEELVRQPRFDADQVCWDAVAQFSAEALAGKLAGVLDQVRRGGASCSRN